MRKTLSRVDRSSPSSFPAGAVVELRRVRVRFRSACIIPSFKMEEICTRVGGESFLFNGYLYKKKSVARGGLITAKCIQPNCDAEVTFRQGDDPSEDPVHLLHQPLDERVISRMRFQTALRTCAIQNPHLTPKSVYLYVSQRDGEGAESFPFSSEGQNYLKNVKKTNKTSKLCTSFKEAALRLQQPNSSIVGKEIFTGCDLSCENEGLIFLNPDPQSDAGLYSSIPGGSASYFALHILHTEGAPANAKFLITLHKLFVKKVNQYVSKSVCLGLVLIERNTEDSIMRALLHLCQQDFDCPVFISMDDNLIRTFRALRPAAQIYPSTFSFIQAVHHVGSRLFTLSDMLREHFPRMIMCQVAGLTYVPPAEVKQFLQLVKQSVDSEPLLRPSLKVLISVSEQLIDKFSPASVCALRGFSCEDDFDVYLNMNLLNEKMMLELMFALKLGHCVNFGAYLENLFKCYSANRTADPARLPAAVERLSVDIKKLLQMNIETPRMGFLKTAAEVVGLTLTKLTQLQGITASLQYPGGTSLSAPVQDQMPPGSSASTLIPQTSNQLINVRNHRNGSFSSTSTSGPTTTSTAASTAMEVNQPNIPDTTGAVSHPSTSSSTSAATIDPNRISQLVGVIADRILEQILNHPRLQVQPLASSLLAPQAVPQEAALQEPVAEVIGPVPPVQALPLQPLLQVQPNVEPPQEVVPPVQPPAEEIVAPVLQIQAVPQQLPVQGLPELGLNHPHALEEVQPIQPHAEEIVEPLPLIEAVPQELPGQGLPELGMNHPHALEEVLPIQQPVQVAAVQPLVQAPEPVVPPAVNQAQEAPPPMHQPAEDNDGLCCVCFDNPRSTALSPCGHWNFCYPCARRLPRCALCRSAIVARTYLH